MNSYEFENCLYKCLESVLNCADSKAIRPIFNNALSLNRKSGVEDLQLTQFDNTGKAKGEQVLLAGKFSRLDKLNNFAKRQKHVKQCLDLRQHVFNQMVKLILGDPAMSDDDLTDVYADTSGLEQWSFDFGAGNPCSGFNLATELLHAAYFGKTTVADAGHASSDDAGAAETMATNPAPLLTILRRRLKNIHVNLADNITIGAGGIDINTFIGNRDMTGNDFIGTKYSGTNLPAGSDASKLLITIARTSNNQGSVDYDQAADLSKVLIMGADVANQRWTNPHSALIAKAVTGYNFLPLKHSIYHSHLLMPKSKKHIVDALKKFKACEATGSEQTKQKDKLLDMICDHLYDIKDGADTLSKDDVLSKLDSTGLTIRLKAMLPHGQTFSNGGAWGNLGKVAIHAPGTNGDGGDPTADIVPAVYDNEQDNTHPNDVKKGLGFIWNVFTLFTTGVNVATGIDYTGGIVQMNNTNAGDVFNEGNPLTNVLFNNNDGTERYQYGITQLGFNYAGVQSAIGAYDIRNEPRSILASKVQGYGAIKKLKLLPVTNYNGFTVVKSKLNDWMDMDYWDEIMSDAKRDIDDMGTALKQYLDDVVSNNEGNEVFTGVDVKIEDGKHYIKQNGEFVAWDEWIANGHNDRVIPVADENAQTDFIEKCYALGRNESVYQNPGCFGVINSQAFDEALLKNQSRTRILHVMQKLAIGIKKNSNGRYTVSNIDTWKKAFANGQLPWKGSRVTNMDATVKTTIEGQIAGTGTGSFLANIKLLIDWVSKNAPVLHNVSKQTTVANKHADGIQYAQNLSGGSPVNDMRHMITNIRDGYLNYIDSFQVGGGGRFPTKNELMHHRDSDSGVVATKSLYKHLKLMIDNAMNSIEANGKTISEKSKKQIAHYLKELETAEIQASEVARILNTVQRLISNGSLENHSIINQELLTTIREKAKKTVVNVSRRQLNGVSIFGGLHNILYDIKEDTDESNADRKKRVDNEQTANRMLSVGNVM